MVGQGGGWTPPGAGSGWGPAGVAAPRPDKPNTSSRPYMPGYGIKSAEEGGGLLPWAWAEGRLMRSHDYWVATVRPDGHPHVMPVRGAWNQGAFWFSGSGRSRKILNLRQNPACTVTTDNPQEPVVVEGTAEIVDNRALLAIFLNRINTKYRTSYTLDFLDPEAKACVKVKPARVFGLEQENFTGSPTRWDF
ncbi:MAG TPA: pyridoxamine 5'-phosphate oxidase family protein [Actinomycetota bacterium]|nr:pyridoxamine 5'-phosphate oxidase family protein [Actinomycetota bacterium]